jgi:hypothetical protein
MEVNVKLSVPATLPSGKHIRSPQCIGTVLVMIANGKIPSALEENRKQGVQSVTDDATN